MRSAYWFWDGMGKAHSVRMPSGLMLCCASFLSRVWLSVTPWTVARQAPLSMGILQARILEWVAMPFSGGSSCPRDQTKTSLIAGRFFTIWATGEAPSECLKFGIFYYFINYFFLLKEKLNGLFLLQFQTFKSPVLNFLSSRPYGKVSFAAFHLFFFLSTIDTPILHLCCFAQASSSIPLGSSELVN